MSDEEQYLDVLKRLDIPIEETVSIGRFQNYLAGVLTPGLAYSEALWGAVGQLYEELAPEGVTAITIEYPWGAQVRYIVENHAGLWGYAGMMRIRMEEP